MNNTREYIDFSHQGEYSAEAFRKAISDVLRLIRQILRYSQGTELDANTIANRIYVLDWLLSEIQIKDIDREE